MNRITKCTLLGAVALAVTLAMAASPAGSTDDGEEQFNLMFGGGSAVEYVEAIRQTTGETNIVLRAKVDRIQVPAVRLTGVTLDAALQLLDGQYTTAGNSRYRADVGHVRGPGSRPVYVIEVKEVSVDGPRPVVTRIWAVTDILGSGLEPGDMLTAIEIAMEMGGAAGSPPEIRFHPETQLLLARGGLDQVGSIEEALKGLRDSVAMRGHDAGASAERELATALDELAMMHEQRATLRIERESLMVQCIEMETRFKSAHDEMAKLRHRLEQREDEIAQLKHMLLEVEMRRSMGQKGDG